MTVQLLHRLRKGSDLELSMRSIFEMPTIVELAATIEDILLVKPLE